MSPWGGRKTVLAVNIPGRAPYAVLAPKFKRPAGKADLAGAGLPALVSTTDPNDIEILWDEVPSVESQIERRMSDALQGQEARMEQAMNMQRQWLEAAQNSGAGSPAPGAPPVSAAAEALAQNARQTLAYVTDPGMRRMLVERYRAAGIQIDEDEAT